MLERTSFRKVADLLTDAVVLTDPKGRIVWTNEAFHTLCGHARKYVRGLKPGSFLQGEDTDPETVDRIRQAIRKRQPIQAELLNYHQDGHPYWVSLSITPVKNQQGRLEGFVAIERDVTEDHHRHEKLQDEVGELYSILVKTVEQTHPPFPYSI